MILRRTITTQCAAALRPRVSRCVVIVKLGRYMTVDTTSNHENKEGCIKLG